MSVSLEHLRKKELCKQKKRNRWIADPPDRPKNQALIQPNQYTSSQLSMQLTTKYAYTSVNKVGLNTLLTKYTPS